MEHVQSIGSEMVAADLCDAIGAGRFRLWFDGSTDIRVTDDEVRVGAANLFISDYIRNHFAETLVDIVRRRTGRDLPLVFRVQPDLFRARRRQNLEEAEEAEEALARAPAERALEEAAAEAPAKAAPPAAPRIAPSTRPEPRPLFTLENFVVGPCNRMAYAAARAAIEAPGRDFHPLFIHGGCGLGKTHLLSAILDGLRRGGYRRVACLSAEQFTNRYVAGMKNGSLDSFRHRYRNLDALLIDDVHFLANKPSTQDEFLHTFNEFDGHGRLIVLASDSAPREIQDIQDRLISRFVAGLVVRLAPPDAETRRRILAAKAAQLGRPIDAEVLDYVADHAPGSVRELEGALTRLMAYAALLRQPLALELARQALGDYVTARPKQVTVGRIESSVAEFFGVSVADIHSARRSRLISLARQATMVLARELTELSLAEIARLLGGKNHTTVLATCRKWQGLLKADDRVAWTDRSEHRSMKAAELLEILKERVLRQ